MKLAMRRYQKDEDYWRIRTFLRDVLIINNREQVSWDVTRFDYWRWHGILNMKDGTLEDDVFIWEDENGEIAAVLNREAPGSVFLQIHPELRSPELEEEMLSVAEQYLVVPVGNNYRTLHVWAEQKDTQLKEILKKRGYNICNKRKPEYQRRRILTEPITPQPIADGYSIRSLGDISEHHARCRVSWRAFHPDEPDKHFEDGWYHNIQRAPLYRRDLDLVAVAPDGTFAAFSIIWLDDFTRTGLFEPVGTAPEYQRLGLGRAILTEGLIRLKHLGADIAYVGSHSEAAHNLYAAVGFKTYRILEPWTKEI
jgi:ribosomal protein S18 acetylase RimI-like enzyme